MVTGQALVFLLILQACYAIEMYVLEVSDELDRLSTLSRMWSVSENAMLDCCMRLRSWAAEDPDATDELILARVGGWEDSVEGYLSTVGIVCNLSLVNIVLEPITNQTVDARQMGFLGTNGTGGIFISAMLIGNLEAGGLHTGFAFPIRIAS
jgi:hypothetical protein